MFIRRIEMRELRMRLLHPFETSFGVTQERRIVLITVSDGTHTGYGEVTAGEGPYYSHETSETAWHMLRDFIVPAAIGQEIESARDFGAIRRAAFAGTTWPKAGLETALWDLEAKTRNVPLWKLLGGTRETDRLRRFDWHSTNDRSSSSRRSTRKSKAGYRRIKIKIKPGWDVEVVRQVRAAFPKILLMGDANSAYTLADIDAV